MTLKELIMQVSYDDLLPYLKKYETGHLDSLYSFREAYDILRSMTPAPDYRGEVYVEWSGGEFGEERWIDVCHLDDAEWNEALAKELVVADNVHLSPAELAMHCLWEITYWGFSPDERDTTWERKFGPRRLTNPYEVALDKLEESIWRHQTPRKLRSRGRDGERYMQLDESLNEDNRRNRSKRKRAYRQERREEYLEKMAARERLVRALSTEGSSFTRGDVEFLLHIKYGMRYDYHSVTEGTSGRLVYIAESMTGYQQLDLERFDNAVVFLRIPKHDPLSEEEIEKFKQTVRMTLGYRDILFGSVEEDRETKDVTVVVLLYR